MRSNRPHIYRVGGRWFVKYERVNGNNELVTVLNPGADTVSGAWAEYVFAKRWRDGHY